MSSVNIVVVTLYITDRRLGGNPLPTETSNQAEKRKKLTGVFAKVAASEMKEPKHACVQSFRCYGLPKVSL